MIEKSKNYKTNNQLRNDYIALNQNKMNENKSMFANTLADTISLSMSGCERYGMTWGCDIDCPVLNAGECELKDDENKELYEQALKND